MVLAGLVFAEGALGIRCCITMLWSVGLIPMTIQVHPAIVCVISAVGCPSPIVVLIWRIGGGGVFDSRVAERLVDQIAVEAVILAGSGLLLTICGHGIIGRIVVLCGHNIAAPA